jgi:adenylate cyclase
VASEMTNVISGAYAQALRREVLRSEQQRMRALAIILSALLVVTVSGATLFPGLRDRLFDREISAWVPIMGIGPFVVFELAGLLLMRWRIATDRGFPRIGRFVNALVETSLPGVVTLVLSRYMEPQVVFGFWPPLLYFVFIVLSTLRLDFWLSLWTGFVAAVELFARADWLLPISFHTDVAEATIYYHLSRSIILLMAGAVAGIVARSLRLQFENSVAAAAARDRVTNLFGQHVSPAVVDRLLATQADPSSEIRPVCVLFLDIRGFTAMTRGRPPGETVALLNDFFARMVAVVDRHNGIVNKFLGDGFLAVFGAPLEDPQAAAHAVAAGQEMLSAVDSWNRERPGQTLRVGIGIHAGEAVTGTVGSAERKEYTVIGDTVNLAARLEQLTKEIGARLLVSEAVIAEAGCGEGEALGPMAIRGFADPVKVWRLA